MLCLIFQYHTFFLCTSEMLEVRLFLSHYQVFVSACLVGGFLYIPSDPDLVVII